MAVTGEQAAEQVTDVDAGLAPVSLRERVEVIDVIRGFALFGILLVNIGFFAYPLSEPFYLPPDASDLDHALHWLTAWLAQGKFYPLFSFLFGLGFAIQFERASGLGSELAPVFTRRLMILMAIGLLHGVFIWAGDILTAYAVLGFLLLLAGRLEPRMLLILALGAYGVQLLAFGIFTLLLSDVSFGSEIVSDVLLRMTAGMNDAADLRADAWAAYANGSFMEITQVRLREFSMALQNMAFFGLQVFGIFLLGAWFGRRGFFADTRSHQRLWKNLLLAGVFAGLPLSAVFATLNASIDYLGEPTPVMGVAYLLNLVAGLLMALGYSAAIVFLMQTRWQRVLRLLSPVGRMALTNYLLQSIICTLIFYSYGFGLFGQLDRAQLLAVVLAVFLVQTVFSHWWLARFRFGPFEWLWRSLTYLRWQSMRIEARDEREPGPPF
ncbi:MAG TPA: DUF418 domain-containing protein [Gammaproteobacteria bacterium]